jgi:hypothetical protein
VRHFCDKQVAVGVYHLDGEFRKKCPAEVHFLKKFERLA